MTEIKCNRCGTIFAPQMWTKAVCPKCGYFGKSDRYFSYNEAFQNNSLSTFAADLQNYLQLIELIAEKKHSLTDKDKLMYLAIVVIFILVGGAVAYQIASGKIIWGNYELP